MARRCWVVFIHGQDWRRQPEPQRHFEQISVDVGKKVLGGEAVRTHGGTKHLRETAARKTKPRLPAGSIVKAVIKSRGGPAAIGPYP